ncbi:MAG: Ig-like domain-containing protein [Bdellovibrionales bacterium]|nr:Ig-like domain-containing protein [Bdellovibrionales bacterium]
MPVKFDIAHIVMCVSKQQWRVVEGLLLSLFFTLSSCGLGQKVEGVDTRNTENEVIEELTSALNILGGNDQTGIINTSLPEPLQVQVIDSDGNPVVDTEIQFVVESGSAQVTASTQTNSEGVAESLVTLGNQAQEITIKAIWVSKSKEVEFKAYSSTALLQVLQSPGMNGTSGCAGESSDYGEPFVLQLLGSQNQSVSNTEVVVKISNGSLDQGPYEASKTYQTNDQGEIQFQVTAGDVSGDNYDSDVVITVDVPSISNVPPVVVNLDVTKNKYLLPLSAPFQYSVGTVGVNFWTFNFSVQIKEECNKPAKNEIVTFDKRHSVPPAPPCTWRSENWQIVDWSFFDSVETDNEGIATLTTELMVLYPPSQWAFPFLHQIRATAVGTQSTVFEASTEACKE